MSQRQTTFQFIMLNMAIKLYYYYVVYTHVARVAESKSDATRENAT